MHQSYLALSTFFSCCFSWSWLYISLCRPINSRLKSSDFHRDITKNYKPWKKRVVKPAVYPAPLLYLVIKSKDTWNVGNNQSLNRKSVHTHITYFQRCVPRSLQLPGEYSVIITDVEMMVKTVKNNKPQVAISWIHRLGSICNREVKYLQWAVSFSKHYSCLNHQCPPLLHLMTPTSPCLGSPVSERHTEKRWTSFLPHLSVLSRPFLKTF